MSDELICECGHLISLHIDKADDDGCKHTNESGDSYDCSCFLRPVDIQLAASEAESKDLKSLTNDALTWEYWRDRARDTEKALAEAKGLLGFAVDNAQNFVERDPDNVKRIWISRTRNFLSGIE